MSHGRKRFLVTGCRGTLGSAVMRVLGDSAFGADLPELDITDPASLEPVLREHEPEWIVNCAAMTDVDECQSNPSEAFRVNAAGVALLSMAGCRLLMVSTDHVFGGVPVVRDPILETASPAPVNVYGASKLAGEEEALAVPGNIVVRTSWLFDRRSGIVPFLWRSLSEQGSVTAVSDQEAAVTYAPDLARVVSKLIEQGEEGVFHAVNRGGVTPLGLATVLSDITGGTVTESTWKDLGLAAPRPTYSVLGSVRGVDMPSCRDALDRWRRADD